MTSGGPYPSESNARFVSLCCGPYAAVNIYFNIFELGDERDSPRQRAMVALKTPADVDKLHEDLIERGMHRKGEADHDIQKFKTRCDVTEVEDMDWGYRQFTMWDLDGNELTFFSNLNSDDR
jgi:hypothetical protein